MKVTVKPVPTDKWHGKSGKDSFAQPIGVEVLYDSETGGYATGLTDEETEVYSKKLGVNLDNRFNLEEPHSFWGSNAAKIKLPNHTVIFETDKPIDFVKVKNMKASKQIANSFEEWEKGLWPDATHYIFDETEETKIEASRISKRNKAIQLSMKLTLDEKLSVVQILSNKSFRGRSTDFVDVEIDKIIEDDVDSFLNLTKMDKQHVYAKGVIMEAIFKHKLVKEGLAIKYMGETIGHDVDQAVEYFLNPDNQAMKVAIMEKLIV